MKKIKLSLLVITVFNLSSLLFLSPFNQNISDSQDVLQTSLYLYLWGITCALFFYYLTKIIYQSYNYFRTSQKVILLISCIGMIASVFIPYQASLRSPLNNWHINVAMISTIIYILQFFKFGFHLKIHSTDVYCKLLPSFYNIISFNLVIFIVLAQVSTLLEISFVITMSYYLYYFVKKEHLIKR